jgi:hypothetical protein
MAKHDYNADSAYPPPFSLVFELRSALTDVTCVPATNLVASAADATFPRAPSFIG